MRPSISEILLGMKSSLETDIYPLIEDPRAQSSLRCMGLLLDHILLRVDVEGSVLDKDNLDLKESLIEFNQLLNESDFQNNNNEIRQFKSELETVLNHRSKKKEGVPAISVLQEENTLLKGLFSKAIKCVENFRGDTNVQLYNRLMALVDDLLRRQIDRDSKWINPAFGGKPYY